MAGQERRDVQIEGTLLQLKADVMLPMVTINLKINTLLKEPICRFFFKFRKKLPYYLRVYYAHRIYSHASTEYGAPQYTGVSTIYLSRKYSNLKREKWRFICPNADIHVIDTSDHAEIVKPLWGSLWIEDLQEKLNGGHR